MFALIVFIFCSFALPKAAAQISTFESSVTFWNSLNKTEIIEYFFYAILYALVRVIEAIMVRVIEKDYCSSWKLILRFPMLFNETMVPFQNFTTLIESLNRLICIQNLRLMHYTAKQEFHLLKKIWRKNGLNPKVINKKRSTLIKGFRKSYCWIMRWRQVHRKPYSANTKVDSTIQHLLVRNITQLLSALTRVLIQRHINLVKEL